MRRSDHISKLVLLIAIVFFTGCYYDKESILYPGTSACAPALNPTFASNILPILDARCNNCHAGSSPSAGIKLNSYTEVAKYITPGSLIGSIKHTAGFSPMPKNGTSIPTCEIQQIQDWITAGALNN